jgi:hypothetical protein
MAALYLQVSIISQALIFVTRSRSWSLVERPGFLLLFAFFAAQLVATCIAVYANWDFCRIQGIGWAWGGAIWMFSMITYIPLDVLKFMIRAALRATTSRTRQASPLSLFKLVHCCLLLYLDLDRLPSHCLSLSVSPRVVSSDTFLGVLGAFVLRRSSKT